MSEQQFEELKGRLERLYLYSKQGHWTEKILLTVKDNPKLHAIGIAKLTGFEKEWLKLNIRKLKNLGLTISHHVGYELSPLGNEYLINFLRKILPLNARTVFQGATLDYHCFKCGFR